jgi:hypothetical protein
MNYIVIEIFDKLYPTIVTDSNGFPILFDNLEDAEEEADRCQKGKVIEI